MRNRRPFFRILSHVVLLFLILNLFLQTDLFCATFFCPLNREMLEKIDVETILNNYENLDYSIQTDGTVCIIFSDYKNSEVLENIKNIDVMLAVHPAKSVKKSADNRLKIRRRYFREYEPHKVFVVIKKDNLEITATQKYPSFRSGDMQTALEKVLHSLGII